MKDLTHYFTDSPKSCETSNNSKEVMEECPKNLQNHSNMKTTCIEDSNFKDDIKVLYTNTESNIVDPLSNNTKKGIIMQNDISEKCSPTDTSSKVIDMNSSNETDFNNHINGRQQEASVQPEEDNILNTVTYEDVLRETKIRNISKGTLENDDSLILSDSSNNTRDISILIKDNSEEPSLSDTILNQATTVNTSEREESNAFKLLMNRSKPIQYNSLPCSSHDTDVIKKKSDETRAKLKQYKERLTKLADSKGYVKRKLEELEETERIERRFEKRMKMFRRDGKKECSNNGDNTLNEKQTSSNLLNYFSKTTSEQQQKNIVLSTMVVKAQVHVSDDTVVPITSKVKHQVAQNDNKKRTKSETILSKADDIQLIRSENLSSQSTTKQQHLSMHQSNKPQWSLRIKLQSYNEDESLSNADGISSDDFVFSPKSLSKLKRNNAEQNYDDSDTFKLSDSKKEEKHHKRKKKISDKNIVQENEESAFYENKQSSNNANTITRGTLSRHVRNEGSSGSLSTNVMQKRKKFIFRKLDALKCSKGEIIKRQHKDYNSKLNGNIDETTRINNINNDKCTAASKQSSHCKNSDTKNLKCIENECEIDTDVIIDDQNCIIIKDDSCIANRKSQEKLAPLFVKRKKLDPAIIAARQLFLQSDTSDSRKRTVERKPSTNDLNLSILPFPTISHVTQFDVKSNIDESNIDSSISFKVCNEFRPLLDISQFKFVTNSKKTLIDLSKTVQQPIKVNCEDVLTEIEKQCADVRTMWKTIICIVNGETKKQLINVKDRKRKPYEKRETIQEIQSSVWTSKYRPISTKDIVGNEEAAEKLRRWLDGWKLPLTKDDDSSGDEFYSSDCSYSSSNNSNQIAVLIGPYGSGKTASAYAVAEELGYRVLEVNASSRRTGKKMLKDLQEATKSHRVKKDANQTTLAPITKQRTKNKIPQNSLILIEDVDVIFEEDEGFISATFQLASNTKRPIVMTCRNTCLHLNKIAPQQLQIHFQAVTGTRVSALLELISLAETGWRLPQSSLKELLKDGDLRKALLQLQYLLLSGQPQKQSVCSENLRTSLWKDAQLFLYKPAVKANKRSKSKKHKSNQVSTNNKADVIALNNLADNLDSINLISSLIDIEDPTSTSLDINLTPSLSLEEDIEHYSNVKILGSEIAEWLSHEVLHRKQMIDCTEFHDQVSERQSLTKQMNEILRLTLSQVTPWVLERRVTSIDYLPYVRTICRAENIRNSMKRGNRFYHYLHNLNLPSTVTSSNILTAACNVMQEEPKKYAKR